MKNENKKNQIPKILEAVKTPLRFFTVALLTLETFIGVLVIATSGPDRTFLLYAGIGVFVLILLLVTVILIFKKEALFGMEMKN